MLLLGDSSGGFYMMFVYAASYLIGLSVVSLLAVLSIPETRPAQR